MSYRLEPATVKRRWFAVMGAVVLLLVTALVATFGVTVATYPAVVLMVAASLLSVLGGLDPVPDVVPWYRFVGAGELLFGAVFLVLWVGPAVGGGRSTTDLAMAAVGVANALVFGFIGVDWLRGGRHFDVEAFEPGPILGRRADGADR